MNYDQVPTFALEGLYNELGKEIEKRRDAEAREVWEKLVEQIRLFIKCHGFIQIQAEEGKLFYIDSSSDFSDFSMIHISGN